MIKRFTPTTTPPPPPTILDYYIVKNMKGVQNNDVWNKQMQFEESTDLIDTSFITEIVVVVVVVIVVVVQRERERESS